MSSTPATISIVNWEEFQHYHDRDPPWVKLYRNILTSTPWLLGNDISRLVQISLILLAARWKNVIPYTGVIRKSTNLECPDFELVGAISFLLSVEFVEIQGLTCEPQDYAIPVLATCYTEKRRSDQRRGEQRRAETSLDLGQVEVGDPVRVLFEHWKRTWSHPKAQLDLKRTQSIKRALKSYDVETLKLAIAGYRHSPHHTGNNPRGTVYDDIGLLLRDAAHIEAGLTHARTPERARAPTTAELEERERANQRQG